MPQPIHPPHPLGKISEQRRVIEQIAVTLWERFENGKNLVVRDSHTVHSVGTEYWFGIAIPQPYCHAPVFGWDPYSMRGTDAPVNCQNCVRKHGVRATFEANQPALFDVQFP